MTGGPTASLAEGFTLAEVVRGIADLRSALGQIHDELREARKTTMPRGEAEAIFAGLRGRIGALEGRASSSTARWTSIASAIVAAVALAVNVLRF